MTVAEESPRVATRVPVGSGGGLTLLFALTSFCGAGLLFMVQPMVARLLLPHFGGSASVWSTSNLFFQTLLLAGYAYVHVATRGLGRAWQPPVHGVLLLAPLLVLPVALPTLDVVDGSPVGTLLWALVVMVGLPFVVLSTTGPLLQRWYSWTGLAKADDPYFLFATSNLGSFGGLLAYPFLVEPFVPLDAQRTAWSWGFVLFVGLMVACGSLAWRGARQGAADPEDVASTGGPDAVVEPVAVDAAAPPLSWRTIGLWLFLAFLPSTLSLSVTSHIATDIASVPLMWVAPLAIYLATFVIAFAKVDRDPGVRVLKIALVVTVLAAAVVVAGGWVPLWARLLLDLVLLAVGAYFAHARLAATRPDTEHLTRFYLTVAAGGALGGLLNGVVAPLFFDRVWEYPLVLALLALMGVGVLKPARGRFHPVVPVVLLGLLVAVSFRLLGSIVQASVADLVVVGCAVVLLGGAAWVAVRRPASLAIGVGLAVLAVPFFAGSDSLYRDRTFYGSYVVEAVGDEHQFFHGTTVHGIQDMSDDVPEPGAYYGRTGPVGEVFEAVDARDRIGVVGLGVGTLAAYLQPQQRMTFFEIDPEVVEVARDESLFTFLSTSQGEIDYSVGDGRLSLEAGDPAQYEVLMLDAFTSDSIPMHLLTREAFASYARAMTADGVLMVHISNRVFDLEPVVASAADSLGWDVRVGEGGSVKGEAKSVWMALSSDPARLAHLDGHPDWREAHDERVKWTDDFGSILTVLRLG